MAATSKFDPTYGSPDRPIYPSGQRGIYTASSLSGSYRDGMDNRILAAHPSLSRSTTAVTHGDVLSFFQGLPFDSKLLATNHKVPRQGDLNKVMTATLGISLGDLSNSLNTKQLPASSLEEVKRMKTNLHENIVRARDRVRILHEMLSKFDKCFPSILTRKRSRSDLPSSDRGISPLSSDHTVFGSISKMGVQGQTSAFDSEMPKLEEKTKKVIPNKRTRTSMLDMNVRPNAVVRSHGSMERDREFLGPASVIHSEDRTLSSGVEGWEKSRMKKKRSGIKSEFSTSAVLSRPLDCDQDSKRDMQQRLGIEVRSRSNNVHGFRSGLSNGVVGVGKLDTSQKSGLGMRATPKNDQNSNSHLSDRRDSLVASEKERVNTKTFNRASIRENTSSSLNSTVKMSAVTRGPRSGLGAIPKASPNVHRSIGAGDEWEPSQNSNKLHTVSGTNNRKRTPSTRSPSPPVAQWAGQRPQKIPRVARRSNFVSPVLGHDETPALDTDSNIAGSDNGSGYQRRLSGNAPQKVILKGDQFSSPALSESEESGAAEIKSKDESRKPAEMDEKGGQSLPKIAIQVFPSRKNKVLDEELGLGGGVRRQGRTVRGFSSTRTGNSTSVEKRDKLVTAKQLRSSRLSFDATESKTGRPPTKKLSDRRAYTRPRHPVNPGVPDYHGESDDGYEDLLAAAKAAVNPGHACSSTFWKQMESILGFVSSQDIDFLKQEGDIILPTNPGLSHEDDSTTLVDGFFLTEYEGDQAVTNEAKSVEHLSEQLAPGKVPLVPSFFQRMLSAFIVEEVDDGCCGNDQDLELDLYGIRSDPDEELKCDNWNQWSLGNIQTLGIPASNGYRITATRGYLDESQNDSLECTDIMTDANVVANGCYSPNSFQPDQGLVTNACSESQYNQMSIHERLILEAQSIGIFSEPVSELSQSKDDDVNQEISRLKEKLNEQVLKKKEYLCNLEKSVTKARETQERDIELRAFDKLVRMAYEKYMTCWGPNASCGKGMSAKIAKQAALAFVKRTIERCQKLENTSESCFAEAVFKDVFHSVPSLVKRAESAISDKEGESSKLYVESAVRSSEVTVSASLGSSPIQYCSDDFQSASHISEQTTGKEYAPSNKMKKRDVLGDEAVAGSVGTSLRAPSGIGASLLSGAKGKRTERDREGKSQNKEMQSRTAVTKIGRSSLGNTKGERKSKAKPKQKTTQLSASVNGLLGKPSDVSKEVSQCIQESGEMVSNRKAKKHDDLCLETLPDSEVIDLSNLQIPEMDVLGDPDGLGEQDKDFGSWLDNMDNIDEELQDHDFMGLEIPMDDLADLDMIP